MTRSEEKELSQKLIKKTAEKESHEIILQELSGSEEGTKVLNKKFESANFRSIEECIKTDDQYIPAVNRVIALSKDVLAGDFLLDEVVPFVKENVSGQVDFLLSKRGF